MDDEGQLAVCVSVLETSGSGFDFIKWSGPEIPSAILRSDNQAMSNVAPQPQSRKRQTKSLIQFLPGRHQFQNDVDPSAFNNPTYSSLGTAFHHNPQ